MKKTTVTNRTGTSRGKKHPSILVWPTIAIGGRCLQHGIRLSILGITWLALGALGQACDTPVYRYAMYRWNPAPYEVYYFHDQPVTDADRSLHELIETLSENPDAAANLSLIPIDMARDPDLKTVPPDVRTFWKSGDPKPLPSYLVWAPPSRDRRQDEGVIISGELDTAMLQALTHSPARNAIAQQLETGKAGVLVLLEGKDVAETKRARDVVQQLASGISSGKVPLASALPGETPEEGKAKSAKPQVGLHVIQRDDATEQWLIRTLFAVEDGLPEIDKPMVFPIFGRGRVLPPYIGAGITQELLVECLDFITGPCSCTVKEQNRGMDLLIAYNWDAAADKLAEQFGAEEGNESVLGAEDFFPELIIPAGNTEEEATSPEVASSSAAADPTEAAVPGTKEQTVAAGKTQDQPSAPSTPETAIASLPSSSPTPPPTGANDDTIGAGNMLWTVGAGVALSLLTLFVATFVVLRPR
ncbi:MAG: hypothetical protein VX346_16270 [Planctomycetota bacterium]|nr:hypothetical protein [Planctomycetota bacterium]